MAAASHLPHIVEQREIEARAKARKKTRPQSYVINDRCSSGCSLNGRNLPIADLVTQWFSGGDNNAEILTKAQALGHKLSNGAIGRHRAAHLDAEHQEGVFDPFDAAAEKVDHVKVLEQMIARGARSLPTSKIGPDLLMRAMDMYYKLTQGNVMDDFMNALTAAVAADEADGSVLSEDEAAQATAE